MKKPGSLQGLPQGDHQVKSHSDPGQFLKREPAAFLLRVDNRRGPGNPLSPHLMMIGDQNLHPQCFGPLDFFMVGTPAIHGDHQGRSLVPQATQALLI